MNYVVELHDVKKQFRLPLEGRRRIHEQLLDYLRRSPYSLITVADKLSFRVKEGQFIGIVGPNGSGKSTLLKLIAGVLYPNNGAVRVVGKVAPFIELGVGFQPELTGRDNIFFYGALLGLSTLEIRERFDDIVEFAELQGYMGQRVKNYSTGMQMRLAFAITSHVDADIFLVDEALAVGDEPFQKKCLDFMDKLRGQSKTIIFVSHDLGAIERHCDRVIVLDGGHILVDGDAKKSIDFYKSYLQEKEAKQ